MEFNKATYFNTFGTEGIHNALDYLSVTTPRTLYKFYSLGTKKDKVKLKTLKEEKIWVESFENQNDPFEMINLSINETSVKDVYNKDGGLVINKQDLMIAYQNYLSQYKNFLKFASFTQTMQTNIAMWTYYTNNHKGFCCEFEIIDTSRFGMINIKPVLYEKKIFKVPSEFIEQMLAERLNIRFDTYRAIEESQLKELTYLEFIKILASCKDPSWSHEKEYRVFYKSDVSKSGESVAAKHLNLKIKAIYIGLKCSKKNKFKLKAIGSKLNVPVHEMIKSKENYSLTYT